MSKLQRTVVFMLALCCAMLPVAADAADIADKPFEPEARTAGQRRSVGADTMAGSGWNAVRVR